MFWVVFLLFSLWWILVPSLNSKESFLNGDLFADTYGSVALLGAIVGFVASNKWGCFKSYVGRSLFFFSLGLFFQFLGQLSYTLIYRFTGVENAYPSFGEIFYILTIPSYILAVWYIANSSGIKTAIRTRANKIISVVVPLIFVAASYFLLLHSNIVDISEYDNPIGFYLDYFYPIAQALFVSMAISTFYITRGILGGLMKNKVFFILFSLVFQYVADSSFIYQTRVGTWLAGGSSDYLFVFSYFLMGVAFFEFAGAYEVLNKT